MPFAWNEITEDLQLLLAREAMRRVAETIAVQAEGLAEEIESGALEDRGGVDALLLFAALIREVSGSEAAVGHA